MEFEVDHGVLMVPGIGDSDPGHWQSIWEDESTNYCRAIQKDWNKPILNAWVEILSAQIASVSVPLFLVAHSLGCALVVHWAARQDSASLVNPSYVLGALLVSPGDVEVPGRITSQVRSFAPLPLLPLPFPSIVVASNDDPYVTEKRARFFANRWGSEFVAAGSQGHISTTSGHGNWTAGRRILREFIAKQMSGQNCVQISR